MATNRTVLLKGDPLIKELEANAAITPGDLIERMSTGKCRVHATAGGNAAKLIALENELEGEEIGDAYASTDRVRFAAGRSGDEFNMRLAASENVAIGDFLESAGDGTLRKMVTDSTGLYLTEQIVGVALEASNVGSIARIAVEII
jgi:hypothetical protein